jgi:hypothetical protein
MPRPTLLVTAGGSAYLTAMIVLAVTKAMLGTPLFFVCVGVGIVAYGWLLACVWRRGFDGPDGPPTRNRRLFLIGVVFAVAFRITLALPPVDGDNDMMRYLWDGRVQTLGINPYAVTPSDPALDFTHTDETRGMPSARARTPYPPAAQLFFRLVVSLHDSSRAMKLALVACELLTMLVLWRWLIVIGRSQWLVLVYGWNPLVVLEVAHSGHIDALAALWVTGAAFWLSRKRTALATVAFVLAVATKVLPIVIAPLFWRRITLRDALIGTGLLVLLYLPFASGTDVFFGIQNVVRHIRFNGPVFRFFSLVASPEMAARIAVGLGLVAAVWCRWKLGPDDPAGWAWPMAVAIACAPVVYPWYLLPFMPFVLLRTTLPLAAWSCSVLMTYVVWEIARNGGRWFIPWPVLVVEYGIVAAATALLVWQLRRGRSTAPAT